MTRSELIQFVTEQTKLPREDIQQAIAHLIEYLGDCLQEGERIEIRDFGAFFPVTFSERQRRNPRTGAPVEAPETRYVRFQPGKGMRDRVQRAYLDHTREQQA